MANSVDPDQLASSEANWSGSTLFANAAYIHAQQDKDQCKKMLSSMPKKKVHSQHAAHAQSLIRACALYWNILQNPMILFVNSKGPDQTLQMCWLIWAFAVHMPGQVFA